MPATMNAAFRLVLQHMNDTGESPEKTLDTDLLDRSGLVLSGYEDITPGKRIRLTPAAADQAVTFTDALLVAIISRDYPFSWRAGLGETLFENVRFMVVGGYDTTAGVAQTSVLLSGNGTNEADLEIWIIEKP